MYLCVIRSSEGSTLGYNVAPHKPLNDAQMVCRIVWSGVYMERTSMCDFLPLVGKQSRLYILPIKR